MEVEYIIIAHNYFHSEVTYSSTHLISFRSILVFLLYINTCLCVFLLKIYVYAMYIKNQFCSLYILYACHLPL